MRFQKFEGTNDIREVLYTRSTWAIKEGKEAHSACVVDGYAIRVRHYERRNSRKYSRNITSAVAVAAAMANLHSFPIETFVRL